MLEAHGGDRPARYGEIHFLAFDLPPAVMVALLRPIRPVFGRGTRSILRWPQRGVCLLRRRSPDGVVHPVRQHRSWRRWCAGAVPLLGLQNASLGDGSGSERTRLHRSFQSRLSVRGQVRPAGQGQRQGQGRGTGRLHPAELPGPRPACRELRGPQRCSRRTVPPAPVRRAAAGPTRRPSASVSRRDRASSLATLPPGSL